MTSIVNVIAAHLSPSDPSAARSTALGLFTILVATMQLARAVSDPALSDDILAAGIHNATVLLDVDQTPIALREGPA
jgi:TetR/AcrR family transcriptional regulator, transcriptional repressor for nem operon